MIVHRSSLLVAGLVVLICSCSARSDDLLLLGAEAERVARSSGSGTAEHPIGYVGPWTLVFMPRATSLRNLQDAGVDPDLAVKLSGRSQTYQDQNCVAFVDGSSTAFAAWPTAAGNLPGVVITKGSNRLVVQVHLATAQGKISVSDVTVRQ